MGKKISLGEKFIIIRSNENTRDLLKRAYELSSRGYDVSITSKGGKLGLKLDILVNNESELN